MTDWFRSFDKNRLLFWVAIFLFALTFSRYYMGMSPRTSTFWIFYGSLFTLFVGNTIRALLKNTPEARNVATVVNFVIVSLLGLPRFWFDFGFHYTRHP